MKPGSDTSGLSGAPIPHLLARRTPWRGEGAFPCEGYARIVLPGTPSPMSQSYACKRCSKSFEDTCVVLKVESQSMDTTLMEFDICAQCLKSLERWRTARRRSAGKIGDSCCQRCGQPLLASQMVLRVTSAGSDTPLVKIDLCDHCLESLGRWTAQRRVRNSGKGGDEAGAGSHSQQRPGRSRKHDTRSPYEDEYGMSARKRQLYVAGGAILVVIGMLSLYVLLDRFVRFIWSLTPPEG